MALSQLAFSLLPLEQQLPLVWLGGRFLAARHLGPQVVALYSLPPFLVEVYYEPDGPTVLRTRTLPVGARLDAYADYLSLPCS
ncbi:hypothetical protein [Hymenobacter volaticus]|uniref:Uncharacterized protein n=1 Tax=Hymenobacter volaticus TaxID=2932254 RepID=A0ABY4GDS5_9BACT|nr:hypothetical protein [Hymenobacter volaticus]UOQ68917.1 hypothetical protein MUN86_24745 [Hymenobacter volaticus]